MIIGYIGDHCSKFIDMSFKSISDADKIIFVWGMEDQQTKEKLNQWKEKLGEKLIIIENKFNQKDKGMNGRARNVYIEYAKEHFPNEWMLVCDPDEVVEDLSKIKEFIQTTKPGLYSPKMEHFIGDLGHVDAMDQGRGHWVPNRLFKISEVENYPEVEHPVLQPKENTCIGATDCTTIWHLAYIPNLWSIKKRYEGHLAKSNIHTPEFLEQWRDAHLFGTYPKRVINPVQIPDIILKEFGVNSDKYYFQNRQLQNKHWIDVIKYKEYYEL